MVSLNGTNVVFLGDLGNTGGEHLMQDVNLAALKCKMVQMSHHGQNGVGYEVYKALRPSVSSGRHRSGCGTMTTAAAQEAVPGKPRRHETG